MPRQIWATFDNKPPAACNFDLFRAEVSGRAQLGVGQAFRMRHLSQYGRCKLVDRHAWLIVQIVEVIPRVVGTDTGYRVTTEHDPRPGIAEQRARQERFDFGGPARLETGNEP